MDRKPLFSSEKPLPEKSSLNIAAVVVAAATILIVLVGTTLGAGAEVNNNTAQYLEEGESRLLIPDTGGERSDSVNEQRQSMRCALGNNCPPPEEDDE